jgi:hypothetical protein
MKNLKKKIEEVLRVNKIDFTLNYHHKGHEINIIGADEINGDLESWIGYEVLNEYLIGRDILYNFGGTFILQNNKIMIYLSFEGPYEGEFDPVELQIESIFSNEIIKKDVESVIATKIDYSELFVQFGYDESEDFKYLDVSYWNEEGKCIELIEKLNAESILYLKDTLKEYTVSKVPCLNLPPEIDQYYYSECEENRIKYYINTSDMCITWDEIEN